MAVKKHILILLLLSALIYLGCSKSDSPQVDNYIIKIDSIVVPDTILFGNNLIVKFYGKVGENGCYAFYKFDVDYELNTTSITSWGRFTHYEACPENLPVLYGKELIIYNLSKGNNIIKAIQPDGDALSSEVFVK